MKQDEAKTEMQEAQEMVSKNEKALRKAVEEKFGEDQIAKLKKENPRGIVLLQVGDKMAFFKKPDRNIIANATAEGNGSPIMFSEIVARNCFLEGDNELLENDDYFLQLADLFDQLVEYKVTNLLKY